MNLQIGGEAGALTRLVQGAMTLCSDWTAVALIREDVSIYPTDVSLINTRRSWIPVSASKKHLQMAYKHREIYIFITVL